MFSGIISALVSVHKIEESRLYVHCQRSEESLCEGESVALDGICFTVVTVSVIPALGSVLWGRHLPGQAPAGILEFSVDISPETFEKTTAKYWKEGQELNLERALRLNDLVSGHLVTGHVDGIGKVVSYDRKDEFTTIEIQLPEALMKYVVSKGSLAMNGVSLTVNNVCDNKVLFMLIPFTLEKTNLKSLKLGDYVNVETDLIAKYIVK